MKILVTGSKGFVGKNLISNLSICDNIEIYEYDRKTTDEELLNYTKDCDFVYHLAGVNRTTNEEDFKNGNALLLNKILNSLKMNNNKCPVLITSSIQSKLDNPYGISKKMEEDIAFNYADENNVKVYVYRLNNLFGKWCKPNYNSVIATWCYNVSHNLDISVSDRKKELCLCYIDDVCNEFIKCLKDKGTCDEEGFYCVPITYNKTLEEIEYLIKSFKDNSLGIMVPSTGDDFTKKLYSTYISYVPVSEMVVDLNSHCDERGTFCELIRTKECGQVSISTTKPSILRGEHYHNTKIERFIVVSGKAKITFEHVIDHTNYEFIVSGDKLQYVTIPVGYQHRIDNIGDTELVLVLWANELFDPLEPDTYVMKRNKEKK